MYRFLYGHKFPFLPIKCLGEELLGCRTGDCVSAIAKLSEWLYRSAFLLATWDISSSLHPLLYLISLVYCCVVLIGVYVVICHCSFTLHIPQIISHVEHLFICLFAFCLSSYIEMSVGSFSHFYTRVFILKFFTCSQYKSVVRYVV